MAKFGSVTVVWNYVTYFLQLFDNQSFVYDKASSLALSC